ncbi:MAG TPA: GntG family PLP-dependent aldolase [Acidimicrobiia bacterium]|nr:GntG family PLP-dependent aldolase [Acidimicrobiia bacterium]
MAFSDGLADFRSDTVTRPTPAMFEAMASAPLGDDVYHDDPTVLALEEESAEATGKEAAIYVPTGTMGNQLSIMFHTKPGEEVLANGSSHLRSIEAGAAQALSGVGFRTVEREGGRILAEDVDDAMELAGFFPRISLMTWENTHNLSGGRVIPFEVMEKTSARARSHGLSIHIDGARIWNAVAATGIDGPAWAGLADTIQFCFSKGLGAPVGSIVCGSAEAIAEIRYLRRRMGGAMRQAGVIAAAARVGLAERGRLVEDHELAQKLALGFAERFPGSIEPDDVETNLVLVAFEALGMEWSEVADRLGKANIKVNSPLKGGWRVVTHRDVDAADVDRLFAALT